MIERRIFNPNIYLKYNPTKTDEIPIRKIIYYGINTAKISNFFNLFRLYYENFSFYHFSSRVLLDTKLAIFLTIFAKSTQISQVIQFPKHFLIVEF